MNNGIEIRSSSPPCVIKDNVIIDCQDEPARRAVKRFSEDITVTWWCSWRFAGFYFSIGRLSREDSPR